MATLYITEFPGQGRDAAGNLAPVAPLPPVNEQVVAIAGASAVSGVLDDRTGLIRVIADSNCSISLATATANGATPAAPVATTTTLRLAANVPEYFTVVPGQKAKIAVISNV